MYYIIGADGKEYGPVSLEQLKQWVAEGRANSQTQVRRDTSAQWQALGTVPEISTPQPQQPPPPLSSPTPSYSPGARTSGLAIASLVFGSLGIVSCGLTGPVGLILGIIALSKINRSHGSVSGRGMAIAGIIVSAVMSFLMIPIILAMLLPALAKAQNRAQQAGCMNHMRQIQVALRMYASEHDSLPPANSWCDAIKDKVSPEAFKCPSEPDLECAFALNNKLAGTNDTSAPNVILLFSSRAGWNASGGEELLQPHHHSQGEQVNIGLADGSIQSIGLDDAASSKWEP